VDHYFGQASSYREGQEDKIMHFRKNQPTTPTSGINSYYFNASVKQTIQPSN